MTKKGSDLKKILQRAEQGYAYQVMALEIQIEKGGTQCNVETISRLLQLYMIAVQMLQSKSDLRYKYFNAKIQSLVKKRIILEEMQRANNKKNTDDNDLLKEAKKFEMQEKKDDYNMQMYLNKEQISSKKIKEFVDIAETKIKKLETRVQGAIISQDKQLQQRIKMRKMRSQTGSVEKFKGMKGMVLDRNIVGQKIEDFFEPWDIKIAKREPRSDQKISNHSSIHNKKIFI